MAISAKSVCSCLGFGILAFLGVAALQISGTDVSLAKASSSLSDQRAQAMLTESGSLLRQASSNLVPKLKSFSDATSEFVSSNATTARLQLDGMSNTITTHLSLEAWLPGFRPAWTRGGAQVAAKATTGQAIAIAEKMPAVNAVRSNVQHLSDLHSALHIGAPGF